MSKIRTQAIRVLEEMGISYQLLLHAHKAMNVEEAAAERGVPVRQVVKSLLVRRPAAYPERRGGFETRPDRDGDGQHVLALVRGDQRLSLKKLARVVGAKTLEMAPPADVPRVTGYQIGAVAPLGLRRHDVLVFVDHHVLEEPRVSISAGRHDAGLELATEDLVRAVGGQVADITE